MSLENNNSERLQHVLDHEPKVTVFLKPIAAPAAMGLAGFSCSTFITATYVARWWGGDTSPGNRINPTPQISRSLSRNSIVDGRARVFTWSCALASSARDLILCGILTTLATGATIACCLFAYGSGVRTGMKVAAYFWIISAILSWWRVTVYLIEEAFGQHPFTRVFPVFRTKAEKNRPLLAPGLGEPGVKRGMPGVV